MRIEVAETICQKVDGILSLLHDLLSYVDSHDDCLPRQEFRHAIAVCVTELDVEILERVYQAHPQCRPAGLPALADQCRRPDQGD